MSNAQTINVQNVALALLVPSSTEAQTQRRKHFDKEGLQQLAASMKDTGVLNPIVVRPAGKNFEIVAGERRFQAAKLAGLDSIPVSVRDLSDDQVLEVQLIENLQREGLHELHEAEGYEALRKRGLSAIEIADKVGRSKEYVFGRLKLLALSDASRKAFYDDKINASIALLLARIPVEKLQAQALKEVSERHYGNSPMSFRDAADHIQRNYMLRLDQASFDTADATLLKSATACGICPKNTLQQPELFGDVKSGSAGVCTDPACFKAKVTAHNEQVVEKAKAAGKKVIVGAAAKKIFPWENSDSPSSNSGFVDPKAKNYKDPKQRSYKELAGKDAETITVINPHTNEPCQLLPVAAVQAGMKKQGIKLTTESHGSPKSAQQTAALKKAEAKDKLDAALRLEVGKQLVERAPKPLHRDELEQLVDVVYCHSHVVDEVLGDLAKVNLKKATEPQLLKILRIHLFGEVIEDRYDKPDALFGAAKRAGINVEQIRKDLAAAAATKDQPKPAQAKAKKAAKKK